MCYFVKEWPFSLVSLPDIAIDFPFNEERLELFMHGQPSVDNFCPPPTHTDKKCWITYCTVANLRIKIYNR